MPLPDAVDVFGLAKPLELPFRGKTYAVMRPSAADGMKLLSLLSVELMTQNGEEVSDSVKEAITLQTADDAIARLALGMAYEEMVSDGLSGPEIEFAVSTAVICWTVDQEAAEAFWRSGGKVPGATPTQADRPRTATPTPMASASTTRTSGSRKRTTARKRAPAPRPLDKD